MNMHYLSDGKMFQETVDFTIKLGHWFLITCREVIHLLVMRTVLFLHCLT